MKKKTVLIIVGSLLVIALGVVIGLSLNNKKNSNDEVTRVNTLLEKSSVIEGGVSKDKRVEIKLDNEKVDVNSKVEVWLFSDPIYLGEFNLIKKDNGYYELDDISSILKSKNVSAGNHKLLILKDNETLGYVDIKVDSSSNLETTLEGNKEDEPANKTTFEQTGSDEALTDKETSGSDNKNNTINDKQNGNTNNATNDKQNGNTNNANKNNSSNTSKKEDTSTTVKKEEPVEEPKQEEVKCTPKKFKHKYTYVFEDKETCIKNGDHDDAWEYFKANGISAYTYGCEEIIDECGTKYYGVYYGNMEGEKYYY